MKKCLILVACITFIFSCKPDDDDYGAIHPDDGQIEHLAEGYC